MQVVFVEQSQTEIVNVPQNKTTKLKELVKNFMLEDDLQAFLNSKNYTVKSFKHNGYDMVVNAFLTCDHKNLQKFIDYTKSQKTYLYDNAAGNIIEIANRIGVHDIFISKILNLTAIDDKGNYIGPGEILFGLLFDDVKNDASTGDLTYCNVPMEVKCRGGRFGDRPSIGNRIPLDFFIRGLIPQDQIDLYLSQYSDIKDICTHVRAGFDLCVDKYTFYKNFIKIIDDLYGRGNQITSKYISIDDLKSVFLDKKLAKIYIYGKILSKGISHILFIDKNFNYKLLERYDILKDGGLIDDRTLNVGQFKFNDLYPQVSLNTISENV